jgi:hypothetical protein
MQPSEVLTTVRHQLYEPLAAFWTDDELYGYMWQAEHELALAIGCTQVQTTTTSETAVSMYTSPADAMYIERVTWNNVKLKKIDKTDYDALQRVAYGGQFTTGNPMHYYEYGNQICLWPTPASSAAIVYDYTQIPTAITSASTAFTVPVHFHNIIQDYVLWRAFAKDQDDRRTAFYQQAWQQGITRAASFWNKRNGSDFYRVVKEEDSYRNVELGMI